MYENVPEPEGADDGVREFAIPLETPRGEKFLLTGKVRTAGVWLLATAAVRCDQL